MHAYACLKLANLALQLKADKKPNKWIMYFTDTEKTIMSYIKTLHFVTEKLLFFYKQGGSAGTTRT